MIALTWPTVIKLISEIGLPLAITLIEKWNSPDTLTPQDIADLKALGAKTPESQIGDALARAGIDPTSPEAVALLALVK